MYTAQVFFTILLAVSQLNFSEGRPKDTLQKENLKELLLRHSVGYNASTNKEHGKDNGRSLEEEIDDREIDPDDPYMQLLLSMGVEEDGVIKHPKGLHPENSKKLVEERLDRTMEGELETDKEGRRRKQKRMKRNFGPEWQKWPMSTVPYSFASNLVTNRESFLKAVELFDNLTCIRWKPKSPEVETEVGHKGYVLVQNAAGCSSGLGFYGDSEHHITLQEPGCGSVRIAVHEMLHRLGQRHEQSRKDRDRYVNIKWENINPGTEYNFYRRMTYNRNPYDFGSVLQYGLTDFGNGNPTIELRDTNLRFLEYPGDHVFSFYDLKDVLDQYDCTAHCTSPPVCQNSGYVNIKCQCTCPTGFTGDICQTIVTDQDCGGEIYLEENGGLETSVTSPNYPNKIGHGKICRWVVKAPDGYIIKMTIDGLHMAYNPDTLRCYHWLEIQYNLPGQPGIRRCGDVVGETFLTSRDSPTLMIVTMDTKFAGSRTTLKGFKLHFEKEREVCRDSLCKYGVCFPTEVTACQYKCVCQIGYTGEHCDQVIDEASLKCTFERFEKCFFDNIQEGDNFEWGPGFKHTISMGTGPEEAYKGERFLFTEMSSPRKPGDRAVIQTTLPLPAKAGCLSFAYNMFGRHVNKLTLFAEGTNTAKASLWSKEGNQGSDWLIAKVNVPATTGLKLSFEAITGDAWDSDVALDEITWEVGQCDTNIAKDCIEIGKEYEGTHDHTKGGIKCQAWSATSPHTPNARYAYLATESNYCRIADEPVPWCYTTDNKTRWDWCDVPYCIATECMYTPNGLDYTGTVSHTQTGIPCQRWDSQTPHPHSLNNLYKDENYCRNPDRSVGPWCHTQDPDTRWDLCDVPKCELIKDRECLITGRGLDYAGKKAVTTSGKTCLSWTDEAMSGDSNYCRNPDVSPKPWCYVEGETGPVKEYCDIPLCVSANSPCFPNPCKNRGQCDVNETSYSCTCLEGFKGDNCELEDQVGVAECKRTSDGRDYKGTIHVTTSGRTCQVWASQSPHSHGTGTDLPGNYCRNPDGEPSPWCYTTDTNVRYELCDIPDCVTPPLECLSNSDPTGQSYFGTQNVANTGDVCQRWDRQSPHTHIYTGIGDQGNYCRNPDDGSTPWCYTVNPEVRWSQCDIPRC
ncbi:uncharacterized protein LOC125661029 [Ostrea edulis]|uniref:uncharacterized protein LOC125661029 n=1 Tax=Ostrea edulis TaxID=37623 RepID=UPI0024AFDF20|nr:uncharacterized protein LOC125661029 [Ostrea edulis]